MRRAARLGVARHEDLGLVVLAPGFVDAHAHLDLTALAGRLPRGKPFTKWVEALIRERAALGLEELAEGAGRGADRLVETGTTVVGDIDATGAAAIALSGHPLRARTFREVLDAADPARTPAALDRLRLPFERRARSRPGIAPHAPYSVSPGLLRDVRACARRRRIPVCIHWAETREEVDWLARGRGPMRRILRSSPGRGGLDLIAEAGLLSPNLLLVHGNHPGPGDLERIARCGATLAHCPGTHAFFGREPFDLRACLEHGVRVALGTDSMASNEDLDMRLEMALARRSFPWLAPDQVWDMATRRGADALGFAGRAGVLAPGAWADLCAHRLAGLSAREWADPRGRIDALTRGGSSIAAVWIAGRRAEGAARA